MKKRFIFLGVVAVVVAMVYRAIVLSPLQFAPVDLSGKVALVTGGTSGIGLETVKKLAEWNATVIMPVRNVKKGEGIQRDITAHLTSLQGHSTGRVEIMKMDLVSFSSVRAFADEVINKDIHIDILILNAGMQSGSHFLLSDDEVEMVYQVNHLSHFLLTRLLFPALTRDKEKPSRIVHVSSSMHFIGYLDHLAYSADSLNKDEATRRLTYKSYADTKLMNVIYSNSLDRLFRQVGGKDFSKVTSVSVHPGFVISELDRGTPYYVEVFLKILRKLIARPTPDGALTQITAATLPKVLEHGGGLYFEDQCIMNQCTFCLFCSLDTEKKVGVVPNAAASSIAEQNWLWETSSLIVGLPLNFTT